MGAVPNMSLFSTPHPEAPQSRKRSPTSRSCAECRRLKIRCDRGLPCTSCVKRGCGAICPNGALTTGRGNRFVLASTEELHDKIEALSYRVRVLEDALKESHAKISSEIHPLLREDLLAIKMPLQRESAPPMYLVPAPTEISQMAYQPKNSGPSYFGAYLYTAPTSQYLSTSDEASSSSSVASSEDLQSESHFRRSPQHTPLSPSKFAGEYSHRLSQSPETGWQLMTPSRGPAERNPSPLTEVDLAAMISRESHNKIGLSLVPHQQLQRIEYPLNPPCSGSAHASAIPDRVPQTNTPTYLSYQLHGSYS